MYENLSETNVTGYEYLKKIITLPLCLPQVFLFVDLCFNRHMTLTRSSIYVAL